MAETCVVSENVGEGGPGEVVVLRRRPVRERRDGKRGLPGAIDDGSPVRCRRRRRCRRCRRDGRESQFRHHCRDGRFWECYLTPLLNSTYA